VPGDQRRQALAQDLLSRDLGMSVVGIMFGVAVDRMENPVEQHHRLLSGDSTPGMNKASPAHPAIPGPTGHNRKAGAGQRITASRTIASRLNLVEISSPTARITDPRFQA